MSSSRSKERIRFITSPSCTLYERYRQIMRIRWCALPWITRTFNSFFIFPFGISQRQEPKQFILNWIIRRWKWTLLNSLDTAHAMNSCWIMCHETRNGCTLLQSLNSSFRNLQLDFNTFRATVRTVGDVYVILAIVLVSFWLLHFWNESMSDCTTKLKIPWIAVEKLMRRVLFKINDIWLFLLLTMGLVTPYALT